MSGPWPPDGEPEPARAGLPLPLAELLETVSTRRGWRQRLEGARVHQRWEEIAGAQLAAHTEPVRLHGGVLVVRAESSLWATEVRHLAGALVDRANAVLGAGQVHKLRVTSGENRR